MPVVITQMEWNLALFSRYIWLVADDPDQSWYCRCRIGVVDAPWHNLTTHPVGGTGWLWTCAYCSRAFKFAIATKISGSIAKIAKRATPRRQKVIAQNGSIEENVVIATPNDWIELVAPIQTSIKLGERYVFFDGRALPVRHGPVKFTGLFRSHDLPDLPHIVEDLAMETIYNPDYWLNTDK